MPRSDSAPRDEQTLRFEIPVAKLPQDGLALRYEASEAECAALAAFLGILGVEAMGAEIRATRRGRDAVSVRGRVTAEVVQASVVTLDPVPQAIDEAVDLLFVPLDSKPARRRGPEDSELQLDPEEDDLPEIFAGDRIDLGDNLREIIALALDPYPRGAGVDFDGLDTDPDPAGGQTSPFASLTRLGSDPATD